MKTKEEVFVTDNFDETRKIGEQFAGRLLLSNVVALYGDLGSGKTTFIQGLAKGLGITRRIISPTFIIIRRYKLKFQMSPLRSASPNFEGQAKLFYHIDLYRITSERDIQGLGLDEIIKDSQNIVAIEWAKNLGNLMPKKRWNLKLEYLGENKRRITIKNGGT